MGDTEQDRTDTGTDGRPAVERVAEGEPDAPGPAARGSAAGSKRPEPDPQLEIGGRRGPEPTRFGDWEKGGRCIDF